MELPVEVLRVEPQEQQSYLDDVTQNCLVNIRYFVMGIMVLEAILLTAFLLTIDEFRIFAGDGAPGLFTLFYPGMYMILLGVSALFYLIFTTPWVIESGTYIYRAILFYLTFCIIWSIVLTLGDILLLDNFGSGVYGQMLVGVSAFACVMRLRPYILIFVISHLLFIAALFLFGAPEQALIAQIVNGTVAVLMGGLILLRLHFSRLRKFRTARRLITVNADLAEKERRLQELAIRDTLTTVYNRRYLDPCIQKEIARFQRRGNPGSILLFDVDFFKVLNDTYGHPAGDTALRLIASILNDNCRITDVPARYGGDEFCVLLPDTTLEGATIFAEKIRSLVEGLQIPTDQGAPVFCTISGGVVDFASCADSSCKDLFILADDALYRAKALGRNRIEVYGSEP